MSQRNEIAEKVWQTRWQGVVTRLRSKPSLTWGDHFKIARAQAGMSLRQLAEATDTSERTISRIERARRPRGRRAVVERVAKILELNVELPRQMATRWEDAPPPERLKELRIRSGLTKRRIAELADVKIPAISRLEKDETVWSVREWLERAQRVCSVFGETLSTVLTGEPCKEEWTLHTAGDDSLPEGLILEIHERLQTEKTSQLLFGGSGSVTLSRAELNLILETAISIVTPATPLHLTVSLKAGPREILDIVNRESRLRRQAAGVEPRVLQPPARFRQS